MNKLFFSFLMLFSFTSIAFSAPIADITAKSVVFLIKADAKGGKKNVLKDAIYPAFKDLKKESFQEENIHFLVKDVQASFKILALVAKREFADYDVLVRIDLKSDLSASQEEALRTLKDQLKPISKDLVIFKSNNTQFHKVEKDKEKDIAMAFINRWRPEQTKEEGQAYWINNHGPLVMKVGLPPTVKSYTQIHVDLNAEGSLFDTRYMGLSFETITGQFSFVSYFATHPSVKKLNEKLLEDEVNFTIPPLLFVFTKWKL